MMKFLNLFFLSLLLLCSCKKQSNNDKPSALNGTYYSALTVQLNNVIMYTKGGIITDTSIIKKFLRDTIVKSFFYFDKKTLTISSGFAEMTANGKDDISIKVSYKAIYPEIFHNDLMIKGHIIGQLPSEFLVQAFKADTASVPFYPQDTIIYNISKYKPYYKFNYFSSSTGSIFIGQEINWPRIAIVTQSNSYYVPVLSFILKRHRYISAIGAHVEEQFGYKISTAIVNPNLVNEMGSKDTIVLQTGLVKLLKQ